jgi:hypothetical protein
MTIRRMTEPTHTVVVRAEATPDTPTHGIEHDHTATRRCIEARIEHERASPHPNYSLT